MNFDQDFYTVKEIAEIFDVSRPTVYDWMNNRGLEWVRLGARRRITRQALEAFVKVGNTAEKRQPSDMRTPMPSLS